MCDLSKPNEPRRVPIWVDDDPRELAALEVARQAARAVDAALGVGTPRQPAWWTWTEPHVARDVWIGGPPPGGDWRPFPQVTVFIDREMLREKYGDDWSKWPDQVVNREFRVGAETVRPMFAEAARDEAVSTVREHRERASRRLAETRPYSVEYWSRATFEEREHEPETLDGDWDGDGEDQVGLGAEYDWYG